MKAALIVNNVIVNAIVVDDLTAYTPPAGVEMVDIQTIGNDCGIGWTRDSEGIWRAPPPVEAVDSL